MMEIWVRVMEFFVLRLPISPRAGMYRLAPAAILRCHDTIRHAVKTIESSVVSLLPTVRFAYAQHRSIQHFGGVCKYD